MIFYRKYLSDLFEIMLTLHLLNIVSMQSNSTTISSSNPSSISSTISNDSNSTFSSSSISPSTSSTMNISSTLLSSSNSTESTNSTINKSTVSTNSTTSNPTVSTNPTFVSTQTLTTSSSSSISSTPLTTTLSIGTITLPFWVQTGCNISISVDEKDSKYKSDMEFRLSNAYAYSQNPTSLKTRRKRATINGTNILQLVTISRITSGSSPSLLIYYVKTTSNTYLLPSVVISNMNQLSTQQMSLILGVPVTTVATYYDSSSQNSGIDQKLWIIGAVFGALAGTGFIIWLVLFIYSRYIKVPNEPLIEKNSLGSNSFDHYQNQPNEFQFSEGKVPMVGQKPKIYKEIYQTTLDKSVMTEENLFKKMEKKFTNKDASVHVYKNEKVQSNHKRHRKSSSSSSSSTSNSSSKSSNEDTMSTKRKHKDVHHKKKSKTSDDSKKTNVKEKRISPIISETTKKTPEIQKVNSIPEQNSNSGSMETNSHSLTPIPLESYEELVPISSWNNNWAVLRQPDVLEIIEDDERDKYLNYIRMTQANSIKNNLRTFDVLPRKSATEMSELSLDEHIHSLKEKLKKLESEN